MKATIKCINCKVDIIFTNKEVKKLTKEEQEYIEESNTFWENELNKEKEVRVGLFKKELQYSIQSRFTRDAMKANIRKPVGILKCPICENEQYILHKYKEKE